ncbi:MAG: HD domain-containing protein [Solirubrobacterales bacterium]
MNSRDLNDRLAASPAGALAWAELADAGAWVVGGAVRDAVLGREVVDVDIAVADGERDAAKAIARAAGGHAFELSAEFSTWRAVAPDSAWHVDVARLRADGIEADLRARDLTINAIAVPIAPAGGDPIDPCGGLGDLEAGVLRAPAPDAFASDPLRLLRAARLVAELEFRLEEETIRLARAAAGRAGEPAGERQLAELRLLFASPDPVAGLQALSDLGVMTAVLPEVEGLRGVVQTPNHHLDVHGHTIEVLRRLLELESDLEGVAGERAGELRGLLAEPLADGFTRAEALRFGALLHDVGKPATRDDSRGFITFIGHDHVGAEIVEGIARRLKASRALTIYLRGVTLHHLRLGFLASERPVSPRRVHEYLMATEPVAADVTLLTVADRLSARGTGPIASPEMVRAHLELAREMLAAALDRRRDGPPRSPIAGDDLAAELGIEPGPQLGRLIAEVEAGVYAGEVAGPDDAVALAREALERT